MARIILLFSATDDISSSLFEKLWKIYKTYLPCNSLNACNTVYADLNIAEGIFDWHYNHF